MSDTFLLEQQIKKLSRKVKSSGVGDLTSLSTLDKTSMANAFNEILNNFLGQWYGKKWNCIGDSITEHNSKTTKNYHDYIKDMIGCTVTNYGVSGTGYITDSVVGSTSDAFHKRIGSLANSDIISVFGGSNDYGRPENTLPLGTNVDIGYLFRNISTPLISSTNATSTYDGLHVLNVSVPTTGTYGFTFVKRKWMELSIKNCKYLITSEDDTNYYYIGLIGGDAGKYKSFNKTTQLPADVSTGLFTALVSEDNIKIEIVGTKCKLYKLVNNNYILLADIAYTGTQKLGFLTTAVVSGDLAGFNNLSLTPISFYSGVDNVLGRLISNYPLVKKVVFTPLRRNYNLRTDEGLTNTRGETLEQYANAIIEIARKYGIPVLDLYHIGELYPYNSTVVSTYMPDGLHPNEAGHQLISKKILSFFNTL